MARQVVDILAGGPAAHPVNAPIIPPETQAQLLPFCELAEKLGRAARQLTDTRISQVHFSCGGQLADMDTGLLRSLLIKGLFGVTDPPITLVNANLVAREHGLKVVEEKTEDAAPFANLVLLSAPPVVGAVLMAFDAAGTPMSDESYQRLLNKASEIQELTITP